MEPMTHDVTTKSINIGVLGVLHNCASNYLNVDQDRDKLSPGWGKWRRGPQHKHLAASSKCFEAAQCWGQGRLN